MRQLRHFLLGIVLLASRAGLAHAQDLRNTIVGCEDVGCPTSTSCRLTKDTFWHVGLARIPVTSSSLAGLSWVQGITKDSVAPLINEGVYPTLKRAFYLGRPPSLDLNGTLGCAIFFTSVDLVGFLAPGSIVPNQGFCEEAMDSSCLSALRTQAVSVDVAGLSGQDACSKVEGELQNKIDPSCRRYALGRTWGELRSTVISGPEAPQPLTEFENVTSNCWPILPKTDTLTAAESLIERPYAPMNKLLANVFQITPILTVFFPGDKSVVSEAESQMTCMKPVANGSAVQPPAYTSDGAIMGSGNSPALFLLFGVFFGVLVFASLDFSSPDGQEDLPTWKPDEKRKYAAPDDKARYA